MTEENFTDIVKALKTFWKSQRHGRVRSTSAAPKWVRVRESMQTAFPTYYEEDIDTFTPDVTRAIHRLNKMKPDAEGPAYMGSNPSEPSYLDVTKAEVDEDYGDLDAVIDDSVELFDGMPNWGHPLTMCNVIPPGNKAGIIGAMMANTFSPNIIEGEYAWNVMKAEMESAAMISKLIGWDSSQAGGLYTYGGSGCYLYGIKYAITNVLDVESRCKGVRTNGKILVSQQGHYCNMNSTDWLGLGMDNIVLVETDDDTNSMDLEDLKMKINEVHSEGLPVIAIVCTMGTTDAFAIDDVKGVRAILDDPAYQNPEPFGKTLVYCDAVIGWSWLMFSNYDFDANPLGFRPEIVPLIKRNYRKISHVKHADAIGIDFHKTGWAPYNCSMVMIKHINHFRHLMTRPGSAYLQERTCYNPGLYTMEVSRSGSYAMAGWATLKFLGREGFQSVLGGILHVEKYLRDRISIEKDMVCANEDDHGFVTLIRVYRTSVEDSNALFQKELSDPDYLDELNDNNQLQEDTANVLWDWFRSGMKIDGMYGPYTSYTSGFRPTDYNDGFDSEKGVIYALKSFPMNVNITTETMENLIKQIRIARDIAVGTRRRPFPAAEKQEMCPEPYNMPNPPINCGDYPETPAESQIGSLLSGVGRRVRGKKAMKKCGPCQGA